MSDKKIVTVNFLCDTDDVRRYLRMVEEFCEVNGISYLNTEIRFPTNEEIELAKGCGIIQEE